MRNLIRIPRAGLLLATLLLLGSAAARAEVSIEFGVFYDNLAPYGTWIDHPRYQRVWIPRGMPAGWRPYTHGHWVMTEQHGWTWVSDYDWGWAPFHYGRWTFDARFGWIWIPGQVWGPGWVAWRSGGEYIGWAPLPPEAGWDDQYGIVYPEHDDYYGIAPIYWIFIQERYFVTPHVHRYMYVPSRNTTILRITSNVTQFRVVDHRIVNHCVPVRRIEQVTRRPVRVFHVNEFDDHRSWRESHSNTDRVNIFRPRIHRVEPTETIRNLSQPPAPQRHIIKERHEEVYRFGEQPTNKYPQRNEPRRDEPRQPQQQEIHRFGEQPINKYPQQPRVEPQRNDHREQRQPQQDTPRLGAQPTYQTPPRAVPRQEAPRDQQEIKSIRTNPALGGAQPRHEPTQQERKLEKQQQKSERKVDKKHQRDERKIEKQEQQENNKSKSFGRDDDRR